MEKKETEDKKDLSERLKHLEKILKEPVLVSLIVKDGEVKIKSVLTKTALNESSSSEEMSMYGLEDAIDKRDNADKSYFG